MFCSEDDTWQESITNVKPVGFYEDSTGVECYIRDSTCSHGDIDMEDVVSEADS